MLSLLQVCSFCFEKNELLDGWSWRNVPCSTEELAREAFAHLVDEATRLYGEPGPVVLPGSARAHEWPGKLRIGVSGKLVRVLVAATVDVFCQGANPALWRGVTAEDWTGLAVLSGPRDG
jgi:hypothetical protein